MLPLLLLLLALNASAAAPSSAHKPAVKFVELTRVVQAGLYDSNSISWYSYTTIASPDGSITAAGGKDFIASDHEADADKDGKITTTELFSYVRPAVERAAKL